MNGTVLVVDDTESIRVLLAGVLAGLNCHCDALGSGEEAVAWFDANHSRIDLVILDLSLPDRDGASVFTHLRQRDPSVPVVLMSGHGENETAQRLRRHGAAGFLPKPFAIDTVRETVRHWIKIRTNRAIRR